MFIQPYSTLSSKGEENLLIPVHAYPVIDDLQIPPHIDLPAVPLGQRCVCVGHCMCVLGSSADCSLTSRLPRGSPVSLYSSIQPSMLPFTRWCEIIKKSSHLVFFPPVSSVRCAIPLRCSCPIDFEFQVFVVQPHEAFSIQPLTGVNQ